MMNQCSSRGHWVSGILRLLRSQCVEKFTPQPPRTRVHPYGLGKQGETLSTDIRTLSGDTGVPHKSILQNLSTLSPLSPKVHAWQGWSALEGQEA